MTPQERLEQQAATARKGITIVRHEPARRESALRWLAAHPTATPAADEEWRRCLSGEGEPARWLTSGAGFEAWAGTVPLRVLLSSHPFPDLPLWLTMTLTWRVVFDVARLVKEGELARILEQFPLTRTQLEALVSEYPAGARDPEREARFQIHLATLRARLPA